MPVKGHTQVISIRSLFLVYHFEARLPFQKTDYSPMHFFPYLSSLRLNAFLRKQLRANFPLNGVGEAFACVYRIGPLIWGVGNLCRVGASRGPSKGLSGQLRESTIVEGRWPLAATRREGSNWFEKKPTLRALHLNKLTP